MMETHHLVEAYHFSSGKPTVALQALSILAVSLVLVPRHTASCARFLHPTSQWLFMKHPF